MLDKAKKSLRQHHGDPANRKHLLGFFEIQFGVFRAQTFRWVAENAMGYAAYLVASMKRDPTGGSKDSQEHAHNKRRFKEYIELFPSGRIAIAMKEEQYAGKGPQHAAITQFTPPIQHAAPTQFTPPTHTSTASLRSLLVGKYPNQKNLTKTVKRLVSPLKATPCKQTFNCITLFWFV